MERIHALDHTLGGVADLCAPFLEPESPPPAVKHSRKFTFDAATAQPDRIKELDQLYREEGKAKDDIDQHFRTKARETNVRQVRPGEAVTATQQVIQLGATMTAEEIGVIGHGKKEQLTRAVDGHAKSNNLMVYSSTVPGFEVPFHAGDLLNEFYEEYGAPNETEVYMLTQALNLTEETVNGYFQSKVENSKLEKAAETVTRVKDQVRRVKEKGQEKEFQEQVARNEAKAKGEEV